MEHTITGPVTAGNSRIYRAWMWTRALMTRAKMAFVQGATKVRVLLTRASVTTAAAVGTVVAQVGLATKSGWNAGSTLLSKTLGGIAKGALQLGRFGSWIGSKVMGIFGWTIGLFSRSGKKAIQRKQKAFDAWRDRTRKSAKSKVEMGTFAGHSAMTSKTASTVGRTTAGVLGLGTVANIVTGGAVAAKVAALPVIGTIAAAALGPVGLLVTGGVALLGGLFAWAFKRREVNKRMKEIQMEMVRKALAEAKRKEKARLKAEAKEAEKAAAKAAKQARKAAAKAAQAAPIQQPVAAPAPTAQPQAAPAPVVTPAHLTVDLRADGGQAKVVSESLEAIQALQDPAKFGEALDSAMVAEINEAGLLKPPANPEDITDAVVMESFKTHRAKPRGIGATYTPDQIEKRRRALYMGYIAMPSNTTHPTPVG